MEENNENVLQEVVSPREDENVSQQYTEENPVTEGTESHNEEATEVAEDPQDKNWRDLRSTLKEFKNENSDIRRENQYMAKKLVELEQGFTKPKEEEEAVDEDDLVTYKTLKRYEKKLDSKFRENEAKTAIDRVKARFPDFEEVVAADNVEYLRDNEPELVASLQSLKNDPYAQAVAAYKLLKKTDLHLSREGTVLKNRAQENSKKPVSVGAVKKGGALAEAHRYANGLTPELKKSLMKEMLEASKGH